MAGEYEEGEGEEGGQTLGSWFGWLGGWVGRADPMVLLLAPFDRCSI